MSDISTWSATDLAKLRAALDAFRWRAGLGAPNSGTGFNGEYYVDLTAGRIYGPKTSGAWGSGYSFGSGADGADGADGASAYALAVANGFVGDVTAWLESLAGPSGPPGEDGAPGSAGAPGATGATGPAGTDGADYVAPVPQDLGATTALVPDSVYYHASLSSRTFTFSSALTSGQRVRLEFLCSAEITLTFPASYRTGDTGTATSITFPAGNHVILWEMFGTLLKVSDSAWSESAGGDTTAPTLSGVSGTQTGATTATLAVTTDEGDGTLYWFVSASATPPSASDLKAGTGAVFAASETITSTGATSEAATGLTASTTYYLHVLHRDAAGNDSAIVTSAGFTTAASDVTAPTLSSATIGTNGTTLTLVFSEVVTVGAGGNGGFNVDASTGGADINCTYFTGTGTNTLVYALGTTILSGETCDLDYTQPGNGIEDSSGNDLASITSAAVTNNSTQTAGPTLLIDEQFEGPGAEETWDGAWDNDEYTPALAGSYSARQTSAARIISLPANKSEIFVKLAFRFDTAYPNSHVIRIYDEAGTANGDVLGYMGVSNSSFRRWLLNYGYTVGAGTADVGAVDSATIDTTYFLWLHWKSTTAAGNDGIFAMRHSTTDNYSAATEIAVTNGTGSPVVCRRVAIHTPAAGAGYIVDSLQIAETLIE